MHLKNFVATCGKNKTSSNNSIGRFGFFSSTYLQENGLIVANPDTLRYIGNDHNELIRGSTGTDDPDFYFDAFDSNHKPCTYKLEVKMYLSIESYFKNLETTNFHNADYCLAYLLNINKWVFSRKVDNYKEVFTADDEQLLQQEPWLRIINLPNTVTRLQFYIPNMPMKTFHSLTDNQLPDEVQFNFIVHSVANG